ncbi:hypothetical protein BDB00DRAFT_816291 [Zychaea mexicana]|uniref:uncharacterized protein n=1 Tax=Zychaea mexicana TaxID=64656 RepID=UPI0022FF234D|nr:uncharacterized protein BDB00DRAFT_816291 [Zychaea mexicana]KAI9494914.1 hypothetical protein BDB00DRAFT_816291 [Zychaea mexicana]
MAANYTALPQDVPGAETGSASMKPSLLDKTRQWWNKKNYDERAPLLDRKRMTLEPPKKATLKVVLWVVAVIFSVLILGAGLVLWLEDENTEPVQHVLTTAEKLMLELPSNENTRDFLKIYTSEAHLAGSEADKRQAEWTRDKFIEFGIEDTKIETYYTLVNYPLERRLALVSGPEEFRYEAELREDPVDEDETSQDPDVVPTFHGYSKNGSVTGPVVYANYGRLEDFQYLVDHGVNLTGTIALVRYGGAFRGLKVRAAEVFGCVGALVYSDPIDDGPLNKEGYPYVNPAKPYPEGPWRSESSVQRGSVEYLSLITGDPTTPGYASTKDAPRIKMEDSPGLPKIPSLPLSYRDALPLLKATQGRGVRGEHDWAGGLEDVDYYSGPTEGDAILENILDYKITPIWDTIGVIKGSQEPDKAIILGNHRDAWVYGAVDPSSGSASMLELARVFGELLKTGWQPARTIILASWDQEEYGLVGSTEWVEDNSDWLSKEGTVYINVDVAVSGPHFQAQASPSLQRLLYEVTSYIPDPRTNKTVYEAWGDFTNRTGTPAAQPFVGQLGSGSDFVPFLDHLGIASISLEFDGDYGVYHSNYDSFHWMDTYGDPGFYYHQTMVKVWGMLALRLADSPILPLHPGDYADALTEYASRLSVYAESKKDKGPFPILSKAIHKLSKAANKFEKNLARLEYQVQGYNNVASLPSKLAHRVAKANDRLTYFERGLLDPEGIKDRTWFKHVVYAPGLWTGYASQVFPAIADALDEGDADLVKHTEKRAALSINQARKSLKN